jgi:hypothetical protein
MPKEPQGQKRPADVIGNAVHDVRMAAGEIAEEMPEASSKAKAGRSGGKVGGANCNSALRPPRVDITPRLADTARVSRLAQRAPPWRLTAVLIETSVRSRLCVEDGNSRHARA